MSSAGGGLTAEQSSCSFFLFYVCIYFREKGREGERKGEKHQCVLSS